MEIRVLRLSCALPLAAMLTACKAQPRDQRDHQLARDSVRWVTLVDEDSLVLALDTVSLVRYDSAQFRAWLRWRYRFDQPGNAQTGGRPYRELGDHLEVDCPRRRMRSTYLAYRDSAKSLGDASTPDASWFDVLPVSPGERILAETCRQGQSSKLPIVR